MVLLGLSGRAEYLIDNQVQSLGPGSVLWAFSGQSHVLLSDSEDFDMWVFLISERVLAADEGAPFPPLRRAKGVPPRVISEAGLAELAGLAQVVRSEENARAGRLGLRWWLLRAWAYWSAAEGQEGRRVHPAVAIAARLLREDPERDFDEIATEAGLSPGRLSRVFRDQIGVGVVTYRTDQKLAVVDRLLRGERATLTSAAYDAGFGSYSQFFRAFQARRGCCPREFYARP